MMKRVRHNGTDWYLMPCQLYYKIQSGDGSIAYRILEDTIELGDWESGHVVIEDETNGETFMWCGAMFDPDFDLRPSGQYNPDTDFFGFFSCSQKIEYKWEMES